MLTTLPAASSERVNSMLHGRISRAEAPNLLRAGIAFMKASDPLQTLNSELFGSGASHVFRPAKFAGPENELA
jgi:hypothetical protein